ncbi:hypothetical protein KIPB_011042, partial [Kipferlia bialata]|eukprot:g11042.t1
MYFPQGPSRPVIAAYARTPVGAFRGGLKHVPGTLLGSVAISGATRALPEGLRPGVVIMGQAVSAGCGQHPARQASEGAGLHRVPSICVNRVCSSGMDAVVDACMRVTLGRNECVVAGGMESMS